MANLNFSLLNIDKPSGPTSFQISDFIRKSLNLKKTSHMGTLDPKVTGVLPVTLGRACKLSNYFMHKDKTYVGIMRLHEIISEKKLKQEMKNFIGKITQLPPIRSSVKRAERVREVKTFKILEIKEKDVLFETRVEAGTYIRKICHDLGEKIGGAHMLELRRTQAGIFDESTEITLYEFEKLIQENKLDSVLVPAEEAIKKVFPEIQIKIPEEEKFAAFIGDKFVGVYKKFEDGDIVARAEFVYTSFP